MTAAAVAGDSDAFAHLYGVLAPRVRGFLDLRGVEDPEGTTHEVFLQVLPRLKTLHSGWPGLQGLVFSVAHARAVDDLRRRRRRPQALEYAAGDDIRREASAEELAMHRVQTTDLLDVLELLPDLQRSVILLRVLADLSVTTTARSLGRSEASIKKIQAKAVANLRALLAPAEGQPAYQIGTRGGE